MTHKTHLNVQKILIFFKSVRFMPDRKRWRNCHQREVTSDIMISATQRHIFIESSVKIGKNTNKDKSLHWYYCTTINFLLLIDILWLYNLLTFWGILMSDTGYVWFFFTIFITFCKHRSISKCQFNKPCFSVITKHSL